MQSLKDSFLVMSCNIFTVKPKINFGLLCFVLFFHIGSLNFGKLRGHGSLPVLMRYSFLF